MSTELNLTLAATTQLLKYSFNPCSRRLKIKSFVWISFEQHIPLLLMKKLFILILIVVQIGNSFHFHYLFEGLFIQL